MQRIIPLVAVIQERYPVKFITIVFIALALTGCASTSPAPNSFNGQFYMSGDKTCVNARSLSPTRIMCMDAKGTETGYRNAMTAQEIQMYQFQVMQAQAQEQQMMQSINYNNAVMAQNTQSVLNKASVYTPPAVQPIQAPGGNQVRCIGVGIYANCR